MVDAIPPQTPAPVDDSYKLAFLISVTVSCVLSIIGSIFIIVCYLSFQKLKNFAFKIIIYLQIADLIYNISFIISPIFQSSTQASQPNAICSIQGVLLQFSQLSSFFWAGIISLNIYITSVKLIAQPQNYSKAFIFIGYALPMLIALIPLTTSSYNEVYFYCWISGAHETIYTTLLYTVPLWFTLFYIIFVLFRVKRYFISLGLEHEGRQFYKRTVFYPLILLIANGLPTIHRTVILMGVDPPDVLFIIDNVLTNLQGILNALNYGLNDNVKQELKKCFQKNNLRESTTSGHGAQNQTEEDNFINDVLYGNLYQQNLDSQFQSMLNKYEQDM